MKIVNDVVQIEVTDVSAFSSSLQSDLAEYNAGVSPEALLSDAINTFIARVKLAVLSRKVDSIKEATVVAPPSAQDQVNALLEDAKTILGVP